MPLPRARLVRGSCIQVMNNLNENSIDCVITDPPYAGFDQGNSQLDYFIWLSPFIELMRKVCKPSGGIAISQPEKNHTLFRDHFDWETHFIVPDAYADKRGEDAHFLCINAVKDTLSLDKYSDDEWDTSMFENSFHPNARDVKKMASMVQAMSRPGDTVLDPFCGSAAIGVACILLGRSYIGVELYTKRSQDAQQRLELALSFYDE